MVIIGLTNTLTMALINFFHHKQLTDSYMNTFEKEPDTRDDYYNRDKTSSSKFAFWAGLILIAGGIIAGLIQFLSQ